MNQVQTQTRAMPSEEEFDSWKSQGMTQLVMEIIRKRRETLKEQWANGSFSDSFDMAMAVKNAGATGACSAYQIILDLDYQDILGTSDE